jgi:small-conductance mechanosensitive channel
MLRPAQLGVALFLLAWGGGVWMGHAQEAPSPEPAPADTDMVQQVPASDDLQLEQRLQATIGEVEAFQGISVTVQHGVAHLQGTVVDPQQATEAERLAREFEGILYVENDVTAETDLVDRVTPAVSRIQEYGHIFVEYLPVGLVALLILLLTGGIARWIGGWEARRRLRLSPLAWSLVRRLIQVVLVLVGLVVTFDLLGVTSLVGALLGTAGVAGLALGFAFKDIIENYLAGVLLSVRQPFRVNDLVSIDGHEGRVVRLTARELVLFTFEGNHVRLPNATVFKNVLVNYTLNERRLAVFEVGVHPQEDLAAVQRLGIETLGAMVGILEEPPPFARVVAISDSSVTVRYHGWVNQAEADFFKVQSEAIRLVKTALDEAGIDLPEPTYRIIQMPSFEEPAGEEKQMPPQSVQEQARSVDVAPDGRMEAQVDEEAHDPDEPNLLSE